MPSKPAGDDRTRDFYERQGWRVDATGRLADETLFGARTDNDGPIQRRAHERRFAGIREHLAPSGAVDRLLEVGCGGNPEPNVVALADDYTGVDFSSTGLEAANLRLDKLAELRADDRPLTHRTRQADACELPFDDASFDALYSAHMLYHMSDADAQARAIAEMGRVLRPGGRLLLVLANPRPILWPGRLAKRLLADTPVVSGLLRRVRSKNKSPLPYQPMRIGWNLRRLRDAGIGTPECIAYRMASTETMQTLGEKGAISRGLWSAMEWLERDHPHLAARLGTYVTLRGVKA